MPCNNIFSQWRNWIRPLVIAIYIIILVIALPLLVVALNFNNAKTHTQAWLIAGIFVVLAIPISLWGILQHMIHYTKPQLQRYIIRIMWMVPIYAMDAWLALRFKDAAIYLDTLRECYEAYVVYNFMAYLLTFLTTEYPNLEEELECKPQVKHLIPFCCLPPWTMGRPLIDYCKHGVLQYTVVRPLTTAIALVCQTQHVYHEGDFNFSSAWSYLAIINNISQVWAMYCLVLFYIATKDHLAPLKPVSKFVCIKAVVFMTFWQSVLIAALVKVNVIRVDNTLPIYTVPIYTVEDLATGLQDFIICIEMFIAAIAHYYSFSHTPFMDEDGTWADCFASFTSMWDVSDVRADVVDHVRHVGKSVRRTLQRTPGSHTERSPLLSDGSDPSYSQTSLPAVTDFPTVGFMGSRSGSIGTINSLDCLTTESLHSRSFNASMNNYMDLSDGADIHADRTSEDTSQHREGSDQLIDLSENQNEVTPAACSLPTVNSTTKGKGKGKRAKGKSPQLIDISNTSQVNVTTEHESANAQSETSRNQYKPSVEHDQQTTGQGITGVQKEVNSQRD